MSVLLLHSIFYAHLAFYSSYSKFNFLTVFAGSHVAYAEHKKPYFQLHLIENLQLSLKSKTGQIPVSGPSPVSTRHINLSLDS